MTFLKKLALKTRLWFLPGKSVLPERKPVTFEKANTIGLLIYLDNSGHLNAVEEFARELIKQGKKVEGLCYKQKESPLKFSFPCQYFTYNDLDYSGQFSAECINKFIKTPFDYLYSINILPILPFKMIVHKSKARCRIGKYEEKADLDLMIQIDPSKGLDFLLEQMMIYSKKIKTDEVH